MIRHVHKPTRCSTVSCIYSWWTRVLHTVLFIFKKSGCECFYEWETDSRLRFFQVTRCLLVTRLNTVMFSIIQAQGELQSITNWLANTLNPLAVTAEREMTRLVRRSWDRKEFVQRRVHVLRLSVLWLREKPLSHTLTHTDTHTHTNRHT